MFEVFLLEAVVRVPAAPSITRGGKHLHAFDDATDTTSPELLPLAKTLNTHIEADTENCFSHWPTVCP